MSQKTSLTVVRQQDIDFYDDPLIAVQTNDGNIYAALTQMCDALGLNAQGQRRKISNHAVLSRGLQRVEIMSTRRGKQSAYVLRADLVPLWLSGIQASRVDELLRPKLINFQAEAARVLWEAFQTGDLSADDTFNQLLAQGGEAVEAYKMLQGMLQLAKNQIVLQAKVRDNSTRLDAIEAELGNTDRFITVSQAAQLSDAVRSVGLMFSKSTGRNEYGGVYGELHRRFSINSYKRLPSAKFEDAMNWLRQWHEDLTDGEDAPF